MCITLPLNLLKYSRALDREKRDSGISFQVKSNHSLDVKTVANSLNVGPDLGLDWPAKEAANTRTLAGPLTYFPLK